MRGLKTYLNDSVWFRVFVGGGAVCSLAFLLLNLERLVVTFIYLANRDQYSVSSFEITEARYHNRRRGKTTILVGQIDGVEVETNPKFLDVTYGEIQSLRNGTSDVIVEPILFAPSFNRSHGSSPMSYAVLSERFATWEYPQAIAYSTAHVLPALLLWGWFIRSHIQMQRALKAMRDNHSRRRRRR